jgi:hypothetical protein
MKGSSPFWDHISNSQKEVVTNVTGASNTRDSAPKIGLLSFSMPPASK